MEGYGCTWHGVDDELCHGTALITSARANGIVQYVYARRQIHGRDVSCVATQAIEAVRHDADSESCAVHAFVGANVIGKHGRVALAVDGAYIRHHV